MIRLIRKFAAAFRRPTVRVWKLGSLEHRIWPNEVAINRFVNILCSQKPGEDLDIVWGPAVDVTELRDTGKVEVVAGPGIRVTTRGRVVKLDVETGTHTVPGMPQFEVGDAINGHGRVTSVKVEQGPAGMVTTYGFAFPATTAA